MRLYVYISELVKLSDLSSILEDSKVSNEIHGITGILSYNHGHYLQIIEGEDNDVSNLIRNIQKDTRHQNIIEILDMEIEDRFFCDWSMNLVPLLKRNDLFIAFTKHLNEHIDLLSRKQQRLFNIFHQLSSDDNEPLSQQSQTGSLVYSVEEWPDFNVLAPTSCLMSLCGALMRNPTSFRTLTSKKYCGAEVELRSMLNKLNKAGYLVVSQSAHPEPDHKEEHVNLNQLQEGRFQKWRNTTNSQVNLPRAASSL